MLHLARHDTVKCKDVEIRRRGGGGAENFYLYGKGEETNKTFVGVREVMGYQYPSRSKNFDRTHSVNSRTVVT